MFLAKTFFSLSFSIKIVQGAHLALAFRTAEMKLIPDTIDYSESTRDTTIRFILDLFSINVAQGAHLVLASKTAQMTPIPDTIGYSTCKST